MHGKNAIIKSSQVIESKILIPPPVCSFYLLEQVYLVVSLPEVVLDVVILGRNPKLDELVLERARLLEEAMYLSLNLHNAFLYHKTILVVFTPP